MAHGARYANVFSAFRPAMRENALAVCRLHTLAKTMGAATLETRGLISAFHNRCYFVDIS